MPYLPAAGLVLARHRFASLDKISRVTCPVLVGHGALDRVIPDAMLARRSDDAAGPVTRHSIPGTGHNDF